MDDDEFDDDSGGLDIDGDDGSDNVDGSDNGGFTVDGGESEALLGKVGGFGTGSGEGGCILLSTSSDRI